MIRFRVSLIAAVAGTLLISGGCSRSRWLSRRDYAEMHDPFTENGQSESGSSEGEGGVPGVASLADGKRTAAVADSSDEQSAADYGGAEKLNGPKPIQPKSSGHESGGAVAQASYPDADSESSTITNAAASAADDAAPGPSLTDFMEADPESAASEFAAGEPAVSPEQDAAPGASIAGRESATDDFGEFSSADSAEAGSEVETGDAASQGFAEVPDDAESSANEAEVNRFSEWASLQEESPPSDIPQDAEKVFTNIAPASSALSLENLNNGDSDQTPDAAEVAEEMSTESGMETAELPNLFTDAAETDEATADEAAEPLIRPAAAAVDETQQSDDNPFAEFENIHESQSAAPPAGALKTATPAAMNSENAIPKSNHSDPSGSNPFGDQSVEQERKPARKQNSRSTRRPSTDSGFEMDSGWKPSHVVQP
jgi:hypothetical protein